MANFFECICKNCKKNFKSRKENDSFCSRHCKEKSEYIEVECYQCHTSFKAKKHESNFYRCYDCDRDEKIPLEEIIIPYFRELEVHRRLDEKIMDRKRRD